MQAPQLPSARRAISAATTVWALIAIATLIGVIQILRSFRPRAGTVCSTCLANLKQIDGAKETWALENKKKVGDLPTMSDLVPNYIKTEPFCAVGLAQKAQGKLPKPYVLNPLGSNPVCPYYDPKMEWARGHTLGPAPPPRRSLLWPLIR